MRLRFGELSNDLAAQEVISQEVLAFMSRHQRGRVTEEDVAVVQDRIRQRLSGATPIKNTLAAEKRLQAENDEWGKINEFSVTAGRAKDLLEAEKAKKRQAELREMLRLQMQERELMKRKEQEIEHKYAEEEMADIRQWESEEQRKKRLQAEIMAKLKEDRVTQLDEKNSRRERALEKIRMEEERAAARMAYETKAAFEKEETVRRQQKEVMREYLLQNERNKTMREEAKKREWDEDATFQRKWEAILDKQERDRLERLDKMKRIQAQQAEVAASRPENKRWLDPAIIERHSKAREAALEAEERARIARAKDGNKVTTQRIAEQLVEREKMREDERRKEAEVARALMEKVRREEEVEKARKRAMQERKLRFRGELDDQLRDNATRRHAVNMSDVEKLINSSLLDKVQKWETTGRSLHASMELLTSTS